MSGRRTDGAPALGPVQVKQVGVLLFYLLLAVAMTYPLVAHLCHGVLGPPGDNFEYLYKLRWFKEALFDLGVSPFFTGAVFYPQGYPLAMHEMSLAHMVLGMPLTVLGGEVVSYNSLVLASFVLSGFGLFLLVLSHTGQRLAGLVGGTAYAFCSYRLAHLGSGHLNLLGTQWIPLLFLSLEWVLARRARVAAALVGVFFAMSALSSWYYAPTTLILAAAYVLCRAKRQAGLLRSRGLWLLFGLSGLVAAALMAPAAVYTAQQWGQREMAFSLREVDGFSASIGDFLLANPLHPLWGKAVASYYAGRQDVPERIITLSWVAIAAAVAGARWRGKGRQVATDYRCLLGLAVLLALGTTLHVGGNRVYLAVPAWAERLFTALMGLLANRLALHRMPSYYDLRVPGAIYVPLPMLWCYLYLPFFDSMRVWQRYGLFAAFALTVLAGIGVARVLRQAEAARVRRRTGTWFGWACLAVLVFELASAPYALGWTEVRPQPVDVWLAQQPDSGAVAEFPLSRAEHGPRLYASLLHGRPIAYGYGAFFPRWYRDQRPVLWEFPTSESVTLLQKWGVRYVLVGAGSYGPEWPEVQRRVGDFPALRAVIQLEDEVVYHPGWLAEALPDFGRAFITDEVYVYEFR